MVRNRGTRTRSAITILAVAAGTLASASSALAAQRFASPTSTDVVGSCSSIAPCRLDRAVNGASAGDEVIVEPGTYNVTYDVSSNVPVDVHGVPGQPMPRLIGASNLGGDVLELCCGGSISYVYVEGNEPLQTALDLEDVVASDIVVWNPVAGGADLRGATLLRDSVIRAGASNAAIETKDGKTLGTPAKILNSTIVASDGGAAAIKAKQSVGPEVIRNSIVRGGANDVLVYSKASVAIDHSNFRPGYSSGYTDAGANQSADPLLSGDLHLLAGSPAIDAGAADPDLGAADADYMTRVAGAAVDLGAYEYGSAPADPAAFVNPTPGGSGDSTPTTGPKLAKPDHPVQGKKMNVAPVSGAVKVRPPGSSTYVVLGDDASVPVNSTIDATHGVVALTSARGNGDTRAQTGNFWGGVFKVVQRRGGDGYTELHLKGGAFGHCKTGASKKTVVAARKRSRVVRQLWGKDRHGRFRTRGRDGQATVRGTQWLTQDRCDGTLFAVRKGAITVKAKGIRKARLLRAGQRYLARAR